MGVIHKLCKLCGKTCGVIQDLNFIDLQSRFAECAKEGDDGAMFDVLETEMDL